MIVQNYGLYWKREDVHWGSPGSGNQGTLSGRSATAKKSPVIDFRQQAGVYILQDGFRAIYIGQAGSGVSRLFGRLRGHTRNHLAERWDRFSWFGIYPVKADTLDYSYNVSVVKTDVFSILNHLEGVLIAVTEPPLNRQGPKLDRGGQYVQVKNPNQADEDDEIEDE